MTFFQAKAMAVGGVWVRRTGWSDPSRWFTLWRGVWFRSVSGIIVPVQALDYGVDDLTADDWTNIPAALASCPLAPTATTTPASAITNDTATLNGTVNANGADATVTFDYGLTTSYGSTIAGAPSTAVGSTDTTIAANITSLGSNTIYHFRVNGTNSVGTANGSDQSFLTASPGTGGGPPTGGGPIPVGPAPPGTSSPISGGGGGSWGGGLPGGGGGPPSIPPSSGMTIILTGMSGGESWNPPLDVNGSYSLSYGGYLSGWSVFKSFPMEDSEVNPAGIYGLGYGITINVTGPFYGNQYSIGAVIYQSAYSVPPGDWLVGEFQTLVFVAKHQSVSNFQQPAANFIAGGSAKLI